MIDCREAVRRMWAYLVHELAEQPVSEFEEHLDTCQRCCGELEFNRLLRAVVAERDVPPLPDEVRARLEVLLSGPPDSTEVRA